MPSASRKPPSVTTPAQPPDLHARDQDRTGRGGTCVLSAVHHQNMTSRTLLDRDPLRVILVPEDRDFIPVLAGGNIAKREGLADHVVGLSRDGTDALYELVAQAPA